MRRAPALSFLLVTVFLDMLGLGLVVPIMPALLSAVTEDAGHRCPLVRPARLGLRPVAVRRLAAAGPALRPVRPAAGPARLAELPRRRLAGPRHLPRPVDAAAVPCARRCLRGHLHRGQRVPRGRHGTRGTGPRVRVGRCRVRAGLRRRPDHRRSARRRRRPPAVPRRRRTVPRQRRVRLVRAARVAARGPDDPVDPADGEPGQRHRRRPASTGARPARVRPALRRRRPDDPPVDLDVLPHPPVRLGHRAGRRGAGGGGARRGALPGQGRRADRAPARGQAGRGGRRGARRRRAGGYGVRHDALAAPPAPGGRRARLGRWGRRAVVALPDRPAPTSRAPCRGR